MLRELAIIAIICAAVVVCGLRCVLRAMDVSADTNGARLINLLTAPVIWVLSQVPSLDNELIGSLQLADIVLFAAVLVFAGIGLASLANRRPATA